MKILQWLATAVLVVAGVVLLCVPANGQGPSAAKAALPGSEVDGGTEVPPLQSDDAIMPLQSDDAIMPLQSDDEVMPVQSDDAIMPVQSDDAVMPVQSAKGGAPVFVPTRFTVTDAGTVGKPDVVLIPGLASSKSVWDGEVKLLAPNYRLHMLQVGGFAGAPAGPNAGAGMLPGIVEELHGYIGSLPGGAGMKPVVVGHSMGGLLAMMLAEKYPADVRKMVIVDTLPFYALLFNPRATEETVKPMAGAIKAEMVKMSPEDYAAGQKTMLAAMAISEAGQKAAYDSSVASDKAVVAEALYEDLLTDMRGEVGKIKTPTLVLYEYDATAKMPPADAYEAMMQAAYKPMPNVTLVKVEGSRHFIMYDQPGKMDAAMEGWLR